MAAKDEKDKAAERGITLTPAEIALEDAREAWHKKKDDANKIVWKAAQDAVVLERVAGRQAREAAGPPPGVTEQRDASGRISGWTTAAGDAVAAQGGTAG